MSILSKFKDFFFTKEEDVPEITQQQADIILQAPEVEEPLGEPTGKICEYCQKDIYTNQAFRVVANKTLHKKCAKKVMKLAKHQLWG